MAADSDPDTICRYVLGQIDRIEQGETLTATLTGTRLSVADINGDNYPDLIVRAAKRSAISEPSRPLPAKRLRPAISGAPSDDRLPSFPGSRETGSGSAI